MSLPESSLTPRKWSMSLQFSDLRELAPRLSKNWHQNAAVDLWSTRWFAAKIYFWSADTSWTIQTPHVGCDRSNFCPKSQSLTWRSSIHFFMLHICGTNSQRIPQVSCNSHFFWINAQSFLPRLFIKLNHNIFLAHCAFTCPYSCYSTC